MIAHRKGYKVLKDGTCINKHGKSIGTKQRRYQYINIRTNESSSAKVYTHRLQAFQKYGNAIYEQGVVVRHLNNNSNDNSWDNISIGTQQDNCFDYPKQSRIIRASNANKKYSNSNVEEIRKDRKCGMTYKDLMLKYNIPSKGTISYIINKRLLL